MQKQYRGARGVLLIWLLSFNALSSCVSARQMLGIDKASPSSSSSKPHDYKYDLLENTDNQEKPNKNYLVSMWPKHKGWIAPFMLLFIIAYCTYYPILNEEVLSLNITGPNNGTAIIRALGSGAVHNASRYQCPT